MHVMMAYKLQNGLWVVTSILRLGGNFVPAVRAAIRFFEPLLDAVVAEHMFAFRKP
jgi:hypothetical protein